MGEEGNKSLTFASGIPHQIKVSKAKAIFSIGFLKNRNPPPTILTLFLIFLGWKEEERYF